MKKLDIHRFLMILLSVWVAVPLLAQPSQGGFPPSFIYDREKTVPQSVIVRHNIDIQALNAEEQEAESLGMAPRVAVHVPVNYNPENSGEWKMLAGKLVWRLRLRLDGALATLVSYSDFLLPEGSELYLYTPRYTRILGAFNHQTHPQGGSFSTEMLPGDEVVLEWVAPDGKTQADIPELLKTLRLEIDGLGYCFNKVSVQHRQGMARNGAKFGESEWCTININCSEGADWQETKKSVVQMLMLVNYGWYLCSGTLLNNTAQNIRPFIASAEHCLSGGSPQTIDFSKWQFTFHYEAPGCEDAEPLDAKTMVGCVYRAASPQKGGSDGLLLELSEKIPEEWGVLYCGWDRRNLLPSDSTAINIHHPAGDIKKISLLGQMKIDRWPMYQSEGDTGAHIRIKYMRTEHGRSVTEGGSSGSGVFNAEHRFIATLTGGNTSCNDTTGYGYYGRFWYHWDQYGTDSTTRFDYWLDPLKTGAETLDAIYIDPAAPRIDLSRKFLETFRTDDYNQPSAADTFSIKTANLSESVRIWTTEPFEVSADGNDFAVYVQKNGNGTVYVRYNPKSIRRDSAWVFLTSLGFDTVRVHVSGNSCVKLSLYPETTENAYVGQSYSLQLRAEGTDADYRYEITEGRLPEGLQLDTNGLVSGTPREFGFFPFTVRVAEPYLCDEYFNRSLYVVCNVIENFPYVEGFEEGQIPECYVQEYVKDCIDWQFISGVGNPEAPVTGAAQGKYNALFRAESYEGFSTKLITPQLDLSQVNNPALGFSFAQPAWVTDQDKLKVYAKNSAAGDWRLLADIEGNVPEWRDTLIGLPEPTAEYFVAFEGISHFGYGVVIDNIRIAESDVATEKMPEAQPVVVCNNPVKEELSVRLPQGARFLSLYDLSGRLLVKKINPDLTETIDMKRFPAGVYTLVVHTGKAMESKRIIKQ